MTENFSNHRAFVDGVALGHEGDDPHITAAVGADQREYFIPLVFPSVINAHQQERPDVARGLAVGWLL